MTNPPITRTLWHFEASLSEWLDTPTIHRNRSEIFALWCAGYDLRQVADYIAEIEREAK